MKHYFRTKTLLIKELGGCCVNCGSSTNLEFDHINPSTKSFGIGSKIRSYSISRIRNELKKCQLLCHECHMAKNKIDNGEAQHGSLTMYTHHKCRCIQCKQAHNKHQLEYKRMWRRKRREKGMKVS